MLKQITKDVEVGGKTYRLTKMDARTGSYVALRLAAIMHAGDGVDQLSGALNSLTRKDFDELQTIILQRVLKLTGDLPSPILTADGSFVDEELEYDASSVINLTMQCLVFNIGGFFGEAGLSLPAL